MYQALLLVLLTCQVQSFGHQQVDPPPHCWEKDELAKTIRAYNLSATRGVVLTSGQDATTMVTIRVGDLQETDVLTPVYSASKMVTSILINALIDAEVGGLTLDSPVSQYIDWWTTEPDDPRARVTMRHLLSQTAGFGSDIMGERGPPTCEMAGLVKDVECMDDAMGLIAMFGSSCATLKLAGCDVDISDILPFVPPGNTVKQACPVSCDSCGTEIPETYTQESCAKQLYEEQYGQLGGGLMGGFDDVSDQVQPGSHFLYAESNFVIAIHAVEAATGESWNELFKQYVSEPVGLSDDCTYIPDYPIDGGAALACSSRDLSKLLAAYYTGGLVSEPAMQEMEMGQTRALGASLPDDALSDYGLGMWKMCDDDECTTGLVNSIGMDGVLPFIDREAGFWGLVHREGGMAPPGAEASMMALEDVVVGLYDIYDSCVL